MAVVALKLYVILWQFNYHGLMVPPSPDLVAHLRMTDAFINGTAHLGDYPPLLHILTAFFANIFHTTSLGVYGAIAPYWIPLSIVIFYLLANKLFGYRVAFWATLVFGLVSTNPLLNFTDAQYADILGYNIIGPFYVIAFVSLVEKFKYWKIPLVLLPFTLFLSAHHLSAVLLYFVSVVSLIVYYAISYKKDKVQARTSFFTLVVFIGAGFVFFALSKIFFGPLLKNVFDSILHANALVKDVTAKVLDYDSLGSLLPPFLEFAGLSGLGFLLLRVSKDRPGRFASLFVIVWVAVIWCFSRSSFFVLPQRIFREIPLPLSIACGVMVADLAALMKNNWQRIIFYSLFSYMVIINSSQFFRSPFLLPDGFKDQSWYNHVDQEKFEYIKENLTPGNMILENCSNPVLAYKLGKAGYSIKDFTETGNYMTDAEKQEYVDDYLDKTKAIYLLIGVPPTGANPDVYFGQFTNYKKATDILNRYSFLDDDTLKQFSDGSRLVKIIKHK